MVKLLIFAILLASSPASGLIETLFRAENTCYVGCSTNYPSNAANVDNSVYLDACKKGLLIEFICQMYAYRFKRFFFPIKFRL